MFEVRASPDGVFWVGTERGGVAQFDCQGFHTLLPVLDARRLRRTPRREHVPQLQERHHQLEEALASVKTLRGLVPICASCRKIRDDQGFWQQLETFVQRHSEAQFSHGICPDCVNRLYPDIHLDG